MFAEVGGDRSRGHAGTGTTGVGQRTPPPTAEHSRSAGPDLRTDPGSGGGGGDGSWLDQFAAMIASNSARSRSRSPHTTSANSATLVIASSIEGTVST